jgi:predicted neutral ceramidase superfamily lipid hydrolase
MQKDKEDYYQQVFEEEVSQPLFRKNPTAMIAESQENSFIKKYGKRILSNLLIAGGGWLLFASSTIFFYFFVVSAPTIKPPLLKPVIAFIIGLTFLFLGVGKVKKKTDWLIYSTIPLMSLIFSFLITLVPVGWRGNNSFLNLNLLFFLLILFVFYYVKDHFEKSE